ncbi:unnamed protein product (macronuclear) [Paramecium tetraurelia]|uniref:C2H2-type domain-containing protein n=1 Tax=Paramecium tetraurelia TaxID=5888 RepID=A0BT93_PARTE|nr:uncharacterized protein GSPATT00031992001 [Paramecium tetraurelia]CAK61760.1 unnamed protein product [Paramecium tetraurelia]|eukprot:XP_001429158.1 hypothetical protein (macronuclear) [Paramecium tetraurelia strain d4-2]
MPRGRKIQQNYLYQISQQFQKFIIIYHVNKRKSNFKGDKNNEAIVFYEKFGQFSLLKRKLQNNHQGEEKISNENKRIQTQKKHIQKANKVEYQQMNKSNKLQEKQKQLLYQSSHKQFSDNDTSNDSEEQFEVQLLCKKCQKGPYKSQHSYQQHIKKYHQGKELKITKINTFQKGGNKI